MASATDAVGLAWLDRSGPGSRCWWGRAGPGQRFPSLSGVFASVLAFVLVSVLMLMATGGVCVCVCVYVARRVVEGTYRGERVAVKLMRRTVDAADCGGAGEGGAGEGGDGARGGGGGGGGGEGRGAFSRMVTAFRQEVEVRLRRERGKWAASAVSPCGRPGPRGASTCGARATPTRGPEP